MKKLIIACLFALPLAMQAQTLPYDHANTGTVQVTAKVDTEIVPDKIFVGFVLQEITEGKNPLTVEAQETILKKALKSAGFDLSKLSISGVNSSTIVINQKKNKKQEISEKSFEFEAKNAEEISKLAAILDANKAIAVHITRTELSNQEAIEDILSEKAIVKARAKAKRMISAAGGKMGMIRYIMETFTGPIMYMDANARSLEAEPAEMTPIDEPENTLSFRKIKISKEVTVYVEILP